MVCPTVTQEVLVGVSETRRRGGEVEQIYSWSKCAREENRCRVRRRESTYESILLNP